MLGNVRLRGFERVDEFADGALSLFQLLEEAETEGLAEGAEAARDDLESGFRHGGNGHALFNYNITIW